MKFKKIKNGVALKEVFKNNGYNVEIKENNISIEPRNKQFAYLEENDKLTISIKALKEDISKEDAFVLMKELEVAIDLMDYINDMVEK